LLSFGAESFVFQFVIQAIKIKIHENTMLPFCYGCETWWLTLREEHELKEFENVAHRKKFGHETDEATGEWRRLHSEEHYDTYCSPNITRGMKPRKMGLEEHVACKGRDEVHTGFR